VSSFERLNHRWLLSALASLCDVPYISFFLYDNSLYVHFVSSYTTNIQQTNIHAAVKEGVFDDGVK
jgi:hypothetical protein